MLIEPAKKIACRMLIELTNERKKQMKKLRILSTTLLLVLVFSLCACGGTSIKKGWQNDKLGSMLPTPKSKDIEVSVNSDFLFQADINDCSEDEYDAYVLSCKDKGFNIKIYESESGTINGPNSDGVMRAFRASNDKGYTLEVNYKLTNQMSVILSYDLEKES